MAKYCALSPLIINLLQMRQHNQSPKNSRQIYCSLAATTLLLSGLGMVLSVAQARAFSNTERCYSLTVFDPKDRSANLRRSPNGAIIMAVANGTLVTTPNIANITPNWTNVQLGNRSGYIFSKFLHHSIAQVIDPNDRSVNLRRNPNGQVLQALPNRTEVMFLGIQGEWAQVRLLNGRIGYLFAKFLRPPVCGT
jgi:Bacterial SH3 domain